MMVKTQLPAEVWSCIIELLPPSQQATCLSVSRLHHDLAARLLFSIIKIYFTWRLSGLAEAEETFLMLRSWELLDNIICDRRFAAVVRKIVVYSSLADGEMIFERRTLSKALEFVPHLQSFHWVGSSPPFQEDVAKALVTFCPRLQELQFPLDLGLSVWPLTGLHHLTRLQLTGSLIPSLYEPDEMDHAIPVFVGPEHLRPEDFLNIVDANSGTLRELTLLGPHVIDMPIRVFSALTHLEIAVPSGEELTGLELVFHHAAYLESLSLAGWLGFDTFHILQTNSSSLPRLSSFQLLSLDYPVSAECYTMLCDFLRGRTLLQRLSLRLAAPWTTVCMVLLVIKDLPAIRALGLHTGEVELPIILDFAWLGYHLPTTLEALHLAIFWDSDAMDISTLTPLLDALQRMPVLSFLHLFGIGSYLPLTAEDLARDMKHLQIVGRQHRLWDILRPVNSEETLTQWGLRKVRWRTREDFVGNEDGGWLLKYF